MKQIAEVISTNGRTAVIRAERSSMCDGCHSDKCAGECSMYKIFGANKSFEAVADNVCGAEKGDMVAVETADKDVNLSAFFVFVLPLIIGFAAYFAVRSFTSEQVGIIVAFGVFALYFAILAITENFRKNAVPKLKITSVVKAYGNVNNIKE